MYFRKNGLSLKSFLGKKQKNKIKKKKIEVLNIL